MKFTIVKQLDNTFICAYESDYDKMRKIKVGDLLQCEIKKPRNYQFHKLYFALLNMVYNNQERYSDLDDLRRDLTIEAGYYRMYIDIHGEEKKVAKSMSFANMDELEFREFYGATLDTIVKYFNFDKQDVMDNIEQYF